MVMSTSPRATSTNSLCLARDWVGGAVKSLVGRAAGTFGRAPGGRADEQEDALLAGELDLGMHLRAVEGALGDQAAVFAREGEDIAGEPEPELRGDRGAVAHGVDGEAEEDHIGAALGDQRLERRFVDVVLELLRLDGHVDDLVHTLPVQGFVEHGRIPGDHGDGDRAFQLLRSGDELERDVPELPLDMLGDDEDAHAGSPPATRDGSARSFRAGRGPPLRSRGDSGVGAGHGRPANQATLTSTAPSGGRRCAGRPRPGCRSASPRPRPWAERTCAARARPARRGLPARPRRCPAARPA